MDWLLELDWADLFLPHTSLLEIVIRGTITYLALFALLRVVLKRQRGGVAVTDLLVIVLIADAAQNAMSGGYVSITDGVLLVAVILIWSAVLDALGYRYEWFQRLIRPKPLTLYADDHLIRENMAKEYVTKDEIEEQLRLQGLTDLSQVERILLEGDGQLAIIRKDGQRSRHHRREAF